MSETKTLRAQIVELLVSEENQENVNAYAIYCQSVLDQKDKDGKKKNPWMVHNHPQKLAEAFQLIRSQGLVFDGKHITWQSTGISFDYVAYKNKMLLVYPESRIDISVVYKGDSFEVSKDSGRVVYSHKLNNVFETKEEDIVGAYCVIKNDRGEFITTLNADEIKKHRAIAKTDYIWKAWFKEMVLKTVIKKAVKYHFDDVFVAIESEDNQGYDLELLPKNTDPVFLDKLQEVKEQIDVIQTIDELKKFYQLNKGLGKDFDAYVTKRKAELSNS